MPKELEFHPLGKILDGRNRYRAALMAGVDPLKYTFHIEQQGWGGKRFDPRAYIKSKNIHRRHLTAEQKREVIAKLLKAAPEKSNRQIAATVKADDKTVGSVRRELEATAEIPQLTKTIGKDGKARQQPARKPAAPRAKAGLTIDEARARRRTERNIEEERKDLVRRLIEAAGRGLVVQLSSFFEKHIDQIDPFAKDLWVAAMDASIDVMKAAAAELPTGAAT